MHGISCACCGKSDGPVYLHGRCHPDAQTWAYLTLPDKLTVECGACRKHIATFDLAQDEHGNPVILNTRPEEKPAA